MQAKAARRIDGRTPLAAAMLFALAGAAPLGADPLHDFRVTPARPGLAPSHADSIDAAARCARYGEGFVPVVGSDGCVKIGGRLRIDLGVNAPTPAYSTPRDGFNPAAHLRVGR